MTIPELAIRRYALAWTISGLIALFGAIAYAKMGVARFPKVDLPMISVTTVLPGADPETVAASITREIEEAVNSVPGIEHVMSFSSPGVSVVTIQFVLSKDIDVAFNEVQAKVQGVLRKLPRGIDPPVVAKLEVGAAPVLWLALTGNRTLAELNRIARDLIKPRLQNINGVGDVVIGGERKRTIRIWLDLARMQAMGIGLNEVVAALQQGHIRFPGGFLVAGGREFMLKLDFEAHEAKALGEIVVRAHGDEIVRLADIARMEDGLEDFRSLARFDSKPAVGIGLVKVSGANTVAVIREAKRRIREEILPLLPAGVQLTVASDDSRVILGIVAGLKEHLVLSVVLAAFVVWFFLRNLGMTLIVSLAMPVSLLAAIAVAYFAGFTLNLLTLLALLLLVGVVVDDAIVVLENIHRWREQGLAANAHEAAAKGAAQVSFAVIAASLTLVSIFAPVIFMGGMVGRFFKAFAVTVTFGVLASLVVALTLAPMLAARHLSFSPPTGRLYAAFGRAQEAMLRFYRRLLSLALARPKATLVLAALVFAASFPIMGLLGKSLVPNEDEGRFVVRFKLPLGASIHAAQEKLGEIEARLRKLPEVAHMFAAVGLGARGKVNEGIVFVELVPKEKRRRRQWEVREAAQRLLDAIPGVRAFAARPSIVGGMRGEPLQFALVGPRLASVAAAAKKLDAALSRRPEIGKLDMDLELELPQLVFSVDRARAAELGLTPAAIARAVAAITGGLNVARFDDGGRRVDVRVKAAPGTVDTPEALRRIWLATPKGLVRLDEVVHWEKRLAPAVIQRVDLNDAAMFFSQPRAPLGEAIRIVNEEAKKVLAPGMRIIYMGQAAEFGKTAKNALFAFVVAMILVFLVLASQFNSFAQPWVLILAQPLAIVGGVAALWLAGASLNIFSMIGLVLLVGLVAKNSILLVELTNQYRAQGMRVSEALAKACPERMRPVLMTSLTVIFAMLPTALGLGAGTDLARPLAIAVVGGMISSTLLTLVVVPAAYLLLERRREGGGA